MKRNKLLIWQIVAILFSILAGILLHFAYDWSGNNIIVGHFSAVNESTWEHLKLAFMPMLLFTIVESFFIKSNSYLQGKALGIATSLIFIVTFFYTYTGILGYGNSIVNIGSFIVAIILR